MLTRSICVALAVASTVHAAEPDRVAEAIQDNSFLVEEAYNQEPGVVQHILNVRYDVNHQAGEDDRDWSVVFTQEWPVFSQRHQFSYTVPYYFLDGAAGSPNGFGDVLLNYRLQALFESETLPAFAPRFSLVLPTGDESDGLGNDTLGYQFNLPLSKVVHNRWTAHANAGLTLFPGLQDRNPVNYNLGASAIYAVSREFNLMLEWVGEWTESVDNAGSIDREFAAVLSPGVRYAINQRSAQWVVGLAVPVGLNAGAPDVGLFLYASFEHLLPRIGAER